MTPSRKLSHYPRLTHSRLSPLQHGDLTVLRLTGDTSGSLLVDAQARERLHMAMVVPHNHRRQCVALNQAASRLRGVWREHAAYGILLMPSVPQLPVTLGMFFGVKKLSTLPLKQLHSRVPTYTS